MNAGQRRAWVPIVFLLTLPAGGCTTIPGLSTVRSLLRLGPMGASGFTEQDLRSDISAYALHFQATVTAAADDILQESTDPAVDRAALIWKIRLVPLTDEALFASDPQVGFLGLYALAVAQQEYLVNGAGRELFGPQQHFAVEAADDLVAMGRTIAQRFLNDEQQARLNDEVRMLSQKHPIRGVFVPETVQAVVGAITETGTLDWIIHYPMAPFRAVEGVESGAAAIREFNVTADRFSRVVASMPQRVRWNAELLSLEIERRESVASTVASFESMAESADRFSRTAQALPLELRTQLAALLAQVERGQGPLQKTLAEARSTGKEFQPVALSLERTAERLEQAGSAWTALLTEVQKLQARDPSAPPSRPFDIADYERTALRLAEAATELRGVVTEFRGIADSDQPMPGLARIEGAGRAVVDLAAWRGLQLLVAFFALLFVYRRIETHLAARRTGRGGEAPGG